MESILTSIKKLLGIQEEYHHFDADLIMYINGAILGLTQIGVGPESGFVVTGTDDLWTDFIEYEKLLEVVKPLIGFKVRLMFDPPQSSAAVESINNIIKEFEWRAMLVSDPIENWGLEDNDGR